jgi:O-methyltransferase involved in polyketide biosynthesis
LEILENIDYDFSWLNKSSLKFFWQTVIAVRDKIIEDAIRVFMTNNKNPVIVYLGCGLDTLFHRIDDGKVRFYELDLPEVIEIKKRFLQESDRDKFIAKSLFDFTWIDDVKLSAGDRVMFLAPCLLMFFEEDKNKLLLKTLSAKFPEAEMILEIIHSSFRFLIGLAKTSQFVNKFKLNLEFKWGMKDPRQLEEWDRKIQYIEEWNYYNYYRKRWKWIGIVMLIPAMKNLSNKIVHIKFI